MALKGVSGRILDYLQSIPALEATSSSPIPLEVQLDEK